MLKEFNISEKDRVAYINIEPVTQAMRNSLDIIGNPNLQVLANSTVPTNTVTVVNRNASPTKNIGFGKTTCSKFL